MKKNDIWWGFYSNNPFKPSKQNKKQVKNIFLTDTDKDGVMNIFDCRPFIKRLQHVKPNIMMEEELKKLPIFFTGGTGDVIGGGKAHHYTEKKMPKSAYKAKKRFQSAVRKRPEIVGEIKRKKPVAVLFAARGSEGAKGQQMHGYAIATNKRKAREDLPEGSGLAVVRLTSQRGFPYSIYDVHEGAGTTVHELKHIEQFKKYEKKPKLAKKMWKGRYEKKPAEKQAFEAEEKAKRKHTRMTYGTHKYFWKRYNEMIDEKEEE